jgi:hypothetical protein
MIPYDYELFGVIYNGWLPFISVAMCAIVVLLLAFPENTHHLKPFLIIFTVIQLGAWLFINYGFIYEKGVSYRDITSAVPAAQFFSVFGAISIVALVLRLPEPFHRLALVAFGVIIVLGLLPFVLLMWWSFAVFAVALLVALLVFALLALYATKGQKSLHIALRALLTGIVGAGSSFLLFVWLAMPGLG